MRIIVRGFKQDGTRFRPSDWAYRLVDLDMLYNNDRKCVRVSSYLSVCQTSDGSVLRIDDDIRSQNPALYNQLISFVITNNLQCYEEISGNKIVNL